MILKYPRPIQVKIPDGCIKQGQSTADNRRQPWGQQLDHQQRVAEVACYQQTDGDKLRGHEAAMLAFVFKRDQLLQDERYQHAEHKTPGYRLERPCSHVLAHQYHYQLKNIDTAANYQVADGWFFEQLAQISGHRAIVLSVVCL